MKLKSFLKAVPLGIVCSLYIAVNAQPTVPVSPDAAALIKMVNYPVNFNTGVPDISVPLYSIESGNLSLPVTINYHAGGFKSLYYCCGDSWLV